MNDIIFSIIIPVRQSTDYLQETLLKLKDQTFSNFEILVITDNDLPNPTDSIQIGPAFKRNLGASKAKGQYLAFLDDDSYPDSNWLQHIYDILNRHSNLAGICGPCLTPSSDNVFQRASGLFWSSLIGSGGAGTYRNSINRSRYIDDYPSVNLTIKKSTFNRIGGFQTKYWPGEDTILCLDITQKLKQKILYHPSVIVYHHRRPVLTAHLQQITRYALHRGLFARIYPATSLRLGYLLPSLFLIYNIFLIPVLFIFPRLTILFLLPNLIYILLIIINALYFFFTLHISYLLLLLFIITVPITHLYYGYLFIKGYFSSTLSLQPHRLNKKTGQYLGG